MAGLLDFEALPWPYVLAFSSLGLIYALYRRRSDAFEEIGFSSKEVALLCLGSTAGWGVNIPLVPLGNALMTVNLGGALVPLILIGWWIRKGKLNVVRALVGTALVSVVAYKVVVFEPTLGIIATFPYFFLPTAVALAFALLLHPREPLRSVPVAYTAGSLGALLGADLYNWDRIASHYATSGESAVISIGGAGVFDMVFLAGTLAMALDVAVVVALHKARPGSAEAFEGYPGKPIEIRDGARVWAAYLRLRDPTPLERATGAAALSNLALREGDYARAVRLARLAATEILAADRAFAALAETRGALGRDVRILNRVADRAKDAGAGGEAVTRREAGEANETAKLILGSAAPHLGGRNRLEGA